MVNNTAIIVIRLSSLGDIAISIPVLLAFSKQYPNKKIIYVTNKKFSSLIQQVPNIKVIEADLKGIHKGIIGLYRLYKTINKEKVEAVADIHDVIRTKMITFFLKFNNIRIAKINKGRKEKRNLIRKKIWKALTPTYLRYANVFEQLGYPLQMESAYFLKPKMSKHLSKGVNLQKLIGIAPFAAYKSKTYPIELMEQIVAVLNTTKGFNILLFGAGEIENKLMLQWEKKYKNCKSIVGKLPFEEELKIISQLKVMVSMDSSNGHLAALYGIPIISLWGVTHPYFGFYPYKQKINNALLANKNKYPKVPTSVYGNKHPKGYENAIASINPKEVLDKIYEFIY